MYRYIHKYSKIPEPFTVILQKISKHFYLGQNVAEPKNYEFCKKSLRYFVDTFKNTLAVATLNRGDTLHAIASRGSHMKRKVCRSC